MTIASNRAARTEVRDSNRKLSPPEAASQEFKVEVRKSNQLVMEAIARLNITISRLEDKKESQETERRGLNPPVEIEAKSSEMNSRYFNSTLDRRTAGDDELDRIECPRFDGSTPFRDWLYRCEKYFEHYRISEQSKVRKAYYKLDGDAMEWHWDFMEDKRDRFVSWNEYVQNMALRFDRIRVTGSMVQLRKLKQEGLVEDYLQEFEKIRVQAKCSEIEAVKLFLGGLKEKLQCLVRLNGPTTVMKAFDCAIVYERILNPIYHPSPFLSILADEEGSKVEPRSMNNGFEELGVKEVNEECKEFEDNEAKGQNEEEEVDVLQTVEDSMESQSEIRKDAEQVYNLQNVDLQADAGEKLSRLEAARTEGEDINAWPSEIEMSVDEVPKLYVKDEELRPTVQKMESISDPEVVKDPAISSMKGENVVVCQGHGFIVGFEKLKETKNKELCSLVHQELNKGDGPGGVVCLDGVQANKCCYHVLEVMADHVWPCGIIVLLWFNNLNFRSIINCGMTSAVAWDFKKRKKSLEHFLGAKEEKGRFKSQGFHQ